MRITALLAGAALVAFAAPASAQVVGGLGGNVGGGVSVSPGNMGVRDTVGGARDIARDAVSDARDVARDRDVRASADASADASASASRDGASVDLDARIGAEVHSRGGDPLGHLVGSTRDAAGRAQQVLIRGMDGVVRGVRATEVAAEASGMLTVEMTAYEFRRQPEVPDTGRRDRGETPDNRIS